MWSFWGFGGNFYILGDVGNSVQGTEKTAPSPSPYKVCKILCPQIYTQPVAYLDRNNNTNFNLKLGINDPRLDLPSKFESSPRLAEVCYPLYNKTLSYQLREYTSIH